MFGMLDITRLSYLTEWNYIPVEIHDLHSWVSLSPPHTPRFPNQIIRNNRDLERYVNKENNEDDRVCVVYFNFVIRHRAPFTQNIAKCLWNGITLILFFFPTNVKLSGISVNRYAVSNAALSHDRIS